MKICILSDSHDHRHLLRAAVAQAKQQGAEAVLHCGDVVAPSTLRVLQPFGLPVHVIHGNNVGDQYHMSKLAHEPGGVVHYHGQDAFLQLASRRIFMVHYPHYARAMACTGDFDIVCYGHEHSARVEQVPTIRGGQAWLIEPGTVGGIGNRPTYVLADLATLAFTVHDVPTPEPEPSSRSTNT